MAQNVSYRPQSMHPFTCHGSSVKRLFSAPHHKHCLEHHMLKGTSLSTTTQGGTKVYSRGSWLLVTLSKMVLAAVSETIGSH